MIPKRVARALAALAALLLGGPSARARPGWRHAGMSGMSDMDMGHKIVIPPGSEITVADVEFMQGMIAHHAQAVYMTALAASHGATPKVLGLAQVIAQSQVPEIVIMQNWLRRFHQFVPDTSSWHTVHMAGMLDDAQIKALNAAQGVEFDRKFLEYMIQHHSGALKMVQDLFDTPGAGQEVDINVFANDVVTAQTTEIGIMLKLRKDQLP